MRRDSGNNLCRGTFSVNCALTAHLRRKTRSHSSGKGPVNKGAFPNRESCRFDPSRGHVVYAWTV